ncbi:hypothetical protein [Fibrella aquatica]|uniref:hypothetical protein n=1 Tax=Fibrella aquatica TaxID=3242487 RepID=UPI00351F983D
MYQTTLPWFELLNAVEIMIGELDGGIDVKVPNTPYQYSQSDIDISGNIIGIVAHVLTEWYSIDIDKNLIYIHRNREYIRSQNVYIRSLYKQLQSSLYIRTELIIVDIALRYFENIFGEFWVVLLENKYDQVKLTKIFLNELSKYLDILGEDKCKYFKEYLKLEFDKIGKISIEQQKEYKLRYESYLLQDVNYFEQLFIDGLIEDDKDYLRRGFKIIRIENFPLEGDEERPNSFKDIEFPVKTSDLIEHLFGRRNVSDLNASSEGIIPVEEDGYAESNDYIDESDDNLHGEKENRYSFVFFKDEVDNILGQLSHFVDEKDNRLISDYYNKNESVVDQAKRSETEHDSLSLILMGKVTSKRIWIHTSVKIIGIAFITAIENDKHRKIKLNKSQLCRWISQNIDYDIRFDPSVREKTKFDSLRNIMKGIA